MSFKRNIKIIQSLSIYSVIFLNIINNTEAFTVSTPQYNSANTVQYANSSQIQGLFKPSYDTNLTQGYGTILNTINNNNLYNSNSSVSTSDGSVVPQYSASTNLYNSGNYYGNTSITNTAPQYGTNTIQYNNTYNQNSNITNTNGRIYSKTKDKSCQVAYAQSNGSYVLDLSDTYDVNNHGNDIIQDFCNKAKQNNYDFVYIDLCNTDVDTQLVAYWNQILKQNNIQVMWNLSNNNSIDDNTIISLGSLDHIKGLNISNTNVSSHGIMILYELLKNNIDSTIQFINICGINVDQNIKNYLISAFNQHIVSWKQKNIGKEYTVFKNAVIDSYNDTNNYLINWFGHINNGINYLNNGLIQYGNSSNNYSQQQPLTFGQQTITQPSYGLQPAPVAGQTIYGLHPATTIGQTTYSSQSVAPTAGQPTFAQPYMSIPQISGQQPRISQYSAQIPQQYVSTQLPNVY